MPGKVCIVGALLIVLVAGFPTLDIPDVIVGFNARASSDLWHMRSQNLGCQSTCRMHELSEQLHGEWNKLAIETVDTAINASTFLVVDRWGGHRATHFRFLPGTAPPLPAADHFYTRELDATKHISIATTMDPYLLAGEFCLRHAGAIDIQVTWDVASNVPVTFAPYTFFETVVRYPVPSLNEKTEASPVVWVSSNCRSSWGRDELVKELMSFIKIDARGGCQTNAPRFPNNLGNGLDHGYATYKFALVMENTIEWDWVTEKFFLPFQANTIPVYYGAPNVHEWMPGPHSFIDMRNFASPKHLADYLNYLISNETAYREYFDWRERARDGTGFSIPQSLSLRQSLSYTRPNVLCEICNCIRTPSCRGSRRIAENWDTRGRFIVQQPPWGLHAGPRSTPTPDEL